MKNLLTLFVAVVGLSACSDAPTGASEPSAAPVSSERTAGSIGDFSGRWETDTIAGSESRVIIDVASSGEYSMEVRRKGENSDVITESVKGSAFTISSGMAGEHEGAIREGGVLSNFDSWKANVLDRTGVLLSEDGVETPIRWTQY